MGQTRFPSTHEPDQGDPNAGFATGRRDLHRLDGGPTLATTLLCGFGRIPHLLWALHPDMRTRVWSGPSFSSQEFEGMWRWENRPQTPLCGKRMQLETGATQGKHDSGTCPPPGHTPSHPQVSGGHKVAAQDNSERRNQKRLRYLGQEPRPF